MNDLHEENQFSNKPKISVLVAAYNVEKYLPKCLESLMGQTFKDIEIICVNDGSMDNTAEVLRTFAEKDSRIHVITQSNQGQSASENAGLEVAQGQYIMFCDADDWFEPTMCEDMYQTIERENVDFVVCDANVVDEGEESKQRRDDVSYYHLKREGKVDALTGLEKTDINVVIWNKIFKKEIIDKWHIRFPHGLVHNDNGFFGCYVCVAQSAYFLNKPLYNYLRRTSGAVTNATGRKKNDNNTLKNLHYVYDFLDKNNLFIQSKDFFLKRYTDMFGWDYQTILPDMRETVIGDEGAFVQKMQAHLSEADFQQYSLLTHLLNKDIDKVHAYLYGSKKSLFKKLKYKLFSVIFFGKLREKYKQKYQQIKD